MVFSNSNIFDDDYISDPTLISPCGSLASIVSDSESDDTVFLPLVGLS